MRVVLTLAALIVIPLVFLAGIIVTGLNFWVLLSVLVVIIVALTAALTARTVWRRKQLSTESHCESVQP